MKRFTLQLTLAAALCCGVVFAVFGLSQNRVAKDLVVHEWGTFTSIQGSDGVPLFWQSRNVAPLPSFVYNWKHAGLPAGWRRMPDNCGKGEIPMMVQRMETPVVYFYSPREQTIDIKVEFPKGRMTEWYPRADEAGPCFWTNGTHRAITDHMLHWPTVHVLPMSQGKLPEDKIGSHYYAARETDSATIGIAGSGANTATEVEKFLFYRGVGNFPTPLKVSMGDANNVTVENTTSETLSDVFVLEVHNAHARMVHLESLGAKQQQHIPLNSTAEPVAVIAEKISNEMATALTQQKLYSREASAMVKTWKDSWFEEEGVRALYLLPRKWTDEILPISINPQPNELVRVMVGRADVISPDLENKLADAMIKIADGDFEAKVQMKQELHRAGRFSEPLFSRVYNRFQRTHGAAGNRWPDLWQKVDQAMTAGLTFDSDTKESLPKTGEDEVHFTFKVANLSTNDIVIEKAQGSCGCTYPKIPAQPWRLRVGESGELPVTMTLKGKPPGEITKEVTLFTSEGQRKVTVKTIVPAPTAIKTASAAN